MNDVSKKKDSTDPRAPRAGISASRVDRNLSDEERLEIYRQAMYQAALPDLPPIPGFHVCWLTTTNPRDPIAVRVRMGYVLLKPEDLPGLSHETLRNGEYAGYVGVNEMVAAKISLSLYQGYMAESHHHQPSFEETKLAQQAKDLQQQAKRMGADIAIGDGLEAIPGEDTIPEPDFTADDQRRVQRGY